MKRFIAATGFVALFLVIMITLIINYKVYTTQIDIVSNVDESHSSVMRWSSFQLEKNALLFRMELDKIINSNGRVSDVNFRRSFDVFAASADELVFQHGESDDHHHFDSGHIEFFVNIQSFLHSAKEQVRSKGQKDQNTLIGLKHSLVNFEPELKKMSQEFNHQNTALSKLKKEQISNQIQHGLYASLAAGALALLVVLTMLLAWRQHNQTVMYERRLEKSQEDQKLADFRNKAKSEFLANISHDLRTPVHAIMGMVDLLSNSDLPVHQRVLVDHTNKATRHLISLLNDLTDADQTEDGKFYLLVRPVLLNDLINEVDVLMMKFAEPKGLRFSIDRDDSLAPVVITDAKRLHQVLMNIIGNAIKFTDNGFVNVKVYSIARPNEENTIDLHFEVKDNGPGIDKDSLGKIFDRNFQKNPSRQGSCGSSGLGLNISKTIVDLMGGTIRVESEPGFGSVFYVTLPMLTATMTDITPEFPRELDFNHLAGMNVLVADDDELSNIYIAGLMVQLQINCTFCVNGEEVIFEANQKKKFDAILMDLHMPRLDGFKAAKWIHNGGGINQFTPIVAMTSDAVKATKDKAQACGMKFFIAKPIDQTLLMETLSLFKRPNAEKMPRRCPKLLGYVVNCSRTSKCYESRVYGCTLRAKELRLAAAEKNSENQIHLV